MRAFFSAFLLMMLLVLPAAAQGDPAAISQKSGEMRQAAQAKEALRGLTQWEYRAKVDIPAVDCIFVQDGKVHGAIYRSALKDNPKSLQAGELTKVSSVKIMDHGLQIYLASDSCALIAIAQKALAAVFETVLEAKDDQQEKAETQADTKEGQKKNQCVSHE